MMPIGATAQEIASDYAVVDYDAKILTIDGTFGGKSEATDDEVAALTETIKEYVKSGCSAIFVTGSEMAIHDNGYYDNVPAYACALYSVTDGSTKTEFNGKVDLILPDATKLVEWEFESQYCLKSITLPKVTTIGKSAFYSCFYVETLTFGSVITSVGNNAFSYLGDLYSVTGVKTDLVLNCGQMEGNYIPDIEKNEWCYCQSRQVNYTWKSITLTHTAEADDGDCTTDILCSVCEKVVEEGNETHTTEKDENKATCQHGNICDLCGAEYVETNPDNHSFDEEGKCECGAYIITIGNVTAKNFDGTDRVWKPGDNIKVDVWDKDNGGYERTELTYDGTSWGSIVTDTKNPVVFAVIGNGDAFTNKNSYDIFVYAQQEQSQNVDDYDLMYAYKASINTDAQLDLHFKHLFTKITLNIEYGSEFTETPKIEYVLFVSEPLKPFVTITGINDGNLNFEYAEDWIHPSKFIDYGDEADIEAHSFNYKGFCEMCSTANLEAKDFIIVDDYYDTFSVTEDIEDISVTYERILPNEEWNSIYLPIEVPVTEELLGKYEVAYVNDMHSADTDDNGEIDEIEMEIVKIKTGTLHANHSYFIRARSMAATNVYLFYEKTTLHATEETTLNCSSIYMDYAIAGSYKRIKGTDFAAMPADRYYAISVDGGWYQIPEDASLYPFRVYLSMTARDGSPVKVSDEAMRSIRICEKGEGTTGIEEVKGENGEVKTIYDLQGRRVNEITEKGIYIVNGKKVLVK